MTWSRARNEAGSSQQPQSMPSPIVPHAFHAERFPTGQVPGFTPTYHPGWDHVSRPHEAGESGWQEADNVARTRHSSDSEGLPPPVHPRQSVSDHDELDGINTRLGGLEIRISEIQNILNIHVQDMTQSQQ